MDSVGNPSARPFPEPGSGSERGAGELLLAVITGSALAPFVQGVATKAGEDVYAKIKDLLVRRRAAPAAEPPPTPIVLADPRTRIAVELPATLPRTEAARLAAVRVPAAGRDDWLLVRYEPDDSQWTVRVVTDPPATAIEVEPG
ncbi:hypothetical protein [Actinoplanes sp. DH11]|uniref:hypothetical protein n=1 Tax=Actinoplanes sp. DH11 TaxID=2857011 RepID=UPI001E41A372|nr:hypothetical protein [Actinoplanes sp. DH11]